MSDFELEELERELAGDGVAGRGPDLATIRRQGRRRRRVRTAAVGGAAVLAVAAVSGGVMLLDGSGRGDDNLLASEPTSQAPAGLTPLAERALAEIPGARQLSPTKVLIPAPDAAHGLPDIPVTLRGEAVELPEPSYGGVTEYRDGVFPVWLYDGTDKLEMAAGDGNSQPVGTTDITGVIVDLGPRYLGCIEPGAEDRSRDGTNCSPAVLTRHGGKWFLDWGMGTDDFLTPGAPMEVFASDSTLDGADATLAIAGLDGTAVARADFVATDGTVVAGTVEAGTLVPGESIFFGEVPGELAKVIAYDASGEVIEDHPLRDCDDPVDCEVR
ncbi:MULTISPECIES: hypothetical protein [unclassified Nocardioides]|uniref:hypothetical protein n=1 Tax=unclassified Nocardioides TaxID=2615069 RepID=UPI0006F9DCCE|nr:MULTISPECIES: hypothetical protein [unclassified Nocardioides]KRA32734.1 hypothetical protein ASD81_14570 [Nocardioides sp. Root614]KRA89386.1 hypothetical protein ASD84_14835 [Nocardioides sp. Root682]